MMTTIMNLTSTKKVVMLIRIIIGIWDPRKTYTGWDYKRRFGEDALKKLYQAREARHRNIVLMEFTRRLPNISEEEKNRLFDVFSSSEAFGTKIHNALLDALADPVKGWDLNNY